MPNGSLWSTSKKLQFWLLFLLLNSLLFLPRYLLEMETNTIYPSFQKTTFAKQVQELFIFRKNVDIFRFSFEFTILVFLFYFLKNKLRSTIARWILYVSYLLLFIFQVYWQIVWVMFKMEPNFFNDSKQFALGFSIITSEPDATAIFVFLGIIALFILFYFLIKRLLVLVYQLEFSQLFLVLFTGLFLFCGCYKFKMASRGWNLHRFPERVVQVMTYPVARCIKMSVKSKRVLDDLDLNKVVAQSPIDTFTLNSSPNIHLIFIESYGRLLYDDPDISSRYKKVLEEESKSLEKNGWSIASHLSKSPVIGGASWVAYSSFMYGLDFKNHAYYKTLLNNTKLYEYKHLFRLLREKGYKSYWISPISGHKKMPVPYELYDRFYEIDKRFHYKDLQYKSTLYGFGPSPPDQYTLNFVKSELEAKETDPYLLFYITINSHNPFVTPPFFDDWTTWKSLKKGSKETKSSFVANPDTPDYIKAIEYQIKTIANFIVGQGSEDDLFIIVGDHQPPKITLDTYDRSTPLHVISKNKKFINDFNEYGFSNNLEVRDTSQHIRHEGFYSMFLRNFLHNYSTDTTNLPVYLPNGIEAFERED